MARESGVTCGIILTILFSSFISDLCNHNTNVSARSLPSSEYLIKEYLLSSVPELTIECNARINMNGITNVQDILQTKLTTKEGVFGETCDSSSFVSLTTAADSMERNVTAGNLGLESIQGLWLCIAPASSVEKKYTHLGNAYSVNLSNPSNFIRSRRSATLSEVTNNVNEDALPTGSIELKTPPTTKIIEESSLDSITLEEVDETKSSVSISDERTQSSVLNSELRTSEGVHSTTPSNLVVSEVNPSASSSILTSAPTTKDSLSKLIDILSTISVTSERTSNVIDPQVSAVISNPKELKTQVYGMRVEEHSKGIVYEQGTILLQADYDAEIILFGKGLTKDVHVQFTAKSEEVGGRCDVATSEVFQVTEAYEHYAMVKIKLPTMLKSQEFWYLCLREGPSAEAIHQGAVAWLRISTYSLFLPIWIQVIILVLLLALSGLFSGLNLGLMALDKTELKIVSNTGTPSERKCARAIEPVRRHGNFLLCTLLLGNVLVNSSLTILLDTLSSGLIAVIGSTIGIVILGEIVPQAICSRHGLAIGAKTAWLVRIFMVITGLVSWPISKILDYVLGEEIGSTYDRERLKELVRVQDSNDIRVEEQNIIYGALELHKKTVAEVMTKVDDIFMLNIDTILDFNMINEIMQQGYSRIPIYENDKTNIVSVLFIKDLAFIDPDDNTPLKTVSQFYQNVCNFVFEDTTLDVMFKQFKEGIKGHMAFVHRVNNEGDCDPFYEVIGLVTLEDVIEELIQEEIVDETDVFTDNKTKRRRKHIGRRDFKEFFHGGNVTNHRKIQISPQLQVATFQFLRASIEPFKEGQLSEGILKRMLNQDIIHMIKVPDKDPNSQENFLFVQGKPVDFFFIVLEGHVEVTIGRENMTFESGPFSYFGLTALQLPPIGESPSLSSTHISRNSIVGSVQSLDSSKSVFIPDYSVKASTEVTFLKIRRAHYIAARRAFLLEQSQKDPHAGDNFEKEMEKILRAENLNSPVWEVDPETNPDKECSSKDTLLNGSTVRSKSDQDETELSILRGTADNRRMSLREVFPPPQPTLRHLEPRSSSEDDKAYSP